MIVIVERKISLNLGAFFKGRSVLVKYVINACLILVVFSTAFIVSNMILLNNLNRSYQERTRTSVDGAANFLDDRLHLFVTHAINISRDNTLSYLSLHRERVNYNFISRANGLIDYLWRIVVTHDELADIIVFYDGLDIFFNSSSSMNMDMLPHWEATGRFGISFDWLTQDVRSGFFVTDGYVVYYNNYQQGMHVYMLISRPLLEEMIGRLVPYHYGVFTVYTKDNLLLLSSQEYIELEPDIVIYGAGLFIYRFRYTTSDYSYIVGAMTMMTIGIAVLFVSLTVFLLYRIKKGLYDPIGGILQHVNAGWREEETIQDEFAAIQVGIDIMRSNLAKLDKIEDEHRQLVFNQMVTTEDEEALHVLTGIEEQNFCALTILFEDDQGQKDAKRTRDFAKDADAFNCYPIYSVSKYNTFFFFPKDDAAYISIIEWADGYLQEDFCQCGISALYTRPSDIRTALEESIKVFHEQPTNGLELTRQTILPATRCKNGSCKITTASHFKLVSDAFSGDVEKTQLNLLEILDDNEDVSALAKRQLLLCLYDTICMVTDSKKTTASAIGAVPSNRLFIENIYSLEQLFDRLCSDLVLRLEAHESGHDMLIWVEENQNRDISLSDLANKMGMSYNYTGLLFKNKTGMRFVEYLQKKRIEKSMQLLCETDMSIEEIAEAVGLVSSATFFRVFKKIAGITPKSYREAAREGKYNTGS